MTKEQILSKVGAAGIVDLYHIESRPMWFIIDANLLINGENALLISRRDFTRKSFLRMEDNIYFEVPTEWRQPIGTCRRAYGELYFI